MRDDLRPIRGIVNALGVTAVVVLLLVLVLSGCTTEQWDARLKAAETVALAACTARAEAPQIATALRKGLEDIVPGGSVAGGVVSGSCELLGVKQP